MQEDITYNSFSLTGEPFFPVAGVADELCFTPAFA